MMIQNSTTNLRLLILILIILLNITLLSQDIDKENSRLLQLALKQKKYYSGPIDGIIVYYTKKAISSFQQDNNLNITGDFDKEITEFLLNDARKEWKQELEQSIHNKEDIVIHCFVALCCNKCQGIVPVPEFLGKGDDQNGNLYWGAGGGVRTFFDRNKDWRLIKKYAVNDTILERVIYHRNVNGANFYLVADAYHGKYIYSTIDDLLQSSTGYYICDVELENKAVQAGGNSNLLVYIGHNGLMDFTYNKEIIQNRNTNPKEVIILACMSKQFFSELISDS